LEDVWGLLERFRGTVKRDRRLLEAERKMQEGLGGFRRDSLEEVLNITRGLLKNARWLLGGARGLLGDARELLEDTR
jgi:hypothetical protein